MARKKFIPEILEEINKDPKKIHDYKDDKELDTLLKYAFHPNGKMLLPEGDPPFRSEAAPLGLTPAVFRQEINRMYIFCRKDLAKGKREQLFISMLESLHPSEAKILLAVKDRALTKLYKKITYKLAEEVGFVPPEQPKA
jgi:hypothetical protein